VNAHDRPDARAAWPRIARAALVLAALAAALALGFGKETSWRASRPRKQCASTSSLSTQTAIGSAVQYFCLYQTARLTYSATLISTP